jgi:hypothetical protein
MHAPIIVPNVASDTAKDSQRFRQRDWIGIDRGVSSDPSVFSNRGDNGLSLIIVESETRASIVRRLPWHRGQATSGKVRRLERARHERADWRSSFDTLE